MPSERQDAHSMWLGSLVHREWVLLQELRLLQQHCRFLLRRSQGGVLVVESLLKTEKKKWEKGKA